MSDRLFPTHNNNNLGDVVGVPKPRSREQGASQPTTSQDRDPKRAKLHQLFKDIPPVQNGVVSASKEPIFEEGRRVDIQMKDVEGDNAGLFFEDPTTDSSNVPTYEMPLYM